MIHPYLLKQLIPHWKFNKKKLQFFRNKKLIGYDTWASTTFTPYSIYYEVLKPYLYKQFIRRWKLRLRFKHFIRGTRTTPKYDEWRTVISVPPTLETLAVQVPIRTLEIRVIKKYPAFFWPTMPK